MILFTRQGRAWGGGGAGGMGDVHGKGACMAGGIDCGGWGVGVCVAGETATATGGTHPTGMLSRCIFCLEPCS